MTAKQILDSFSETLIQDERILSGRERELLINLLQNAKTVPGGNPDIQSAITATIAHSIGETIAQRAFVLLGESMAEQILAGAGNVTVSQDAGNIFATDKTPTPPRTPQPAEHPEKNSPTGPKPPQLPEERPAVEMPAPGPMPPGGRTTREPVQAKLDPRSGVAVSDLPETERVRCVVMDQFLAPQELEELTCYSLRHEADFQTSDVILPNASHGVIEYEHRRSRVLVDLGKHQAVILKRIQCVLPRILDRLGIEQFPVARTEVQITASNDGDFFRPHTDNGQETVSSRRISFVYFFHSEPRQFAGGELRLHDSAGNSRTGKYESIVPQQNQIVFFPCSMLHEITPVECPTGAFAASRFTLNGWLHG
jgi:hypothetical protein